MNNRFRLERSQSAPGWWVLTDTVNMVVCRFEEHKFNETQKVTVLDDSALMAREGTANELAHIMTEMGDYMATHWYSIAMPTPTFEFRMDDEHDRMLLIRNKHPRFTLELQDECDTTRLANALRAAYEFTKRHTR